VNSLSVEAQSGPLFELFLTAIYVAGVGEVLGVHIDVLGEVLLLGEHPAALLALELLQLTVNCQEVPLQAKPTRELFLAPIN